MPFRARRSGARDREELAFLPAALEIVETPPSPIGRAIACTIIAFFCIALAWACLGQVDIVAIGDGQDHSERTHQGDPAVRDRRGARHPCSRRPDGQGRRGPDRARSDHQRRGARSTCKSDLIAAQLDVARLRAALAETAIRWRISSRRPMRPPALVAIAAPVPARPDRRAAARSSRLSTGRRAQKAGRARDDRGDDRQARSDRCPSLQERLDIRKTLYDHATGSKANYLELLQSFVEAAAGARWCRRASSTRPTAAIAGDRPRQRAQTDAEYRRARFDELVEGRAQGRRASAQDLIKAEQRAELAGAHRAGRRHGAATGGAHDRRRRDPGAGLARRRAARQPVSRSKRWCSNRDIGFVHAGQEAEIKVDTFNFTRYGLLHGKVLSVSPDAITRDKPPDKSQRQDARRRDDIERTERPGAGLCRPRLARSHADADRRQAGQPLARHGGDGRDQDRLAPDHQLSALAAAAGSGRKACASASRCRGPAFAPERFRMQPLVASTPRQPASDAAQK